MVSNFRRDAVNSAPGLNSDPRCPAKATESRTKAGLRMVLLLDSQAWRATGGAPFQFVRWLGALTTVVVNWVQSGTLQSTVEYLPVVAIVALLLLPDIQSIEIAGLKFDRLTDEIARQRRAVDKLSAEVSLISNSLNASSQVNIMMGATAADTAWIAAAQSEHSPREPRQPIEPINPTITPEGHPGDRELQRSAGRNVYSFVSVQTMQSEPSLVM